MGADSAVWVRVAQPDDAEGLCRLTASVAAEGRFIVPDRLFFTPQQQAHVIAARDPACHQIWVGVAEGTVVAEMEVVRGTWPKTAHTATLAVVVAAPHRGRGVFSRCLTAAQAWARAAGVEKLCLTVFATNAEALAAYRRRGFVHEGVRRGQYRIQGQLVDEVLMALWLEAGGKRTPLRDVVDGGHHGP